MIFIYNYISFCCHREPDPHYNMYCFIFTKLCRKEKKLCLRFERTFEITERRYLKLLPHWKALDVLREINKPYSFCNPRGTKLLRFEIAYPPYHNSSSLGICERPVQLTANHTVLAELLSLYKINSIIAHYKKCSKLFIKGPGLCILLIFKMHYKLGHEY